MCLLLCVIVEEGIVCGVVREVPTPFRLVGPAFLQQLVCKRWMRMPMNGREYCTAVRPVDRPAHIVTDAAGKDLHHKLLYNEHLMHKRIRVQLCIRCQLLAC
jgi:hypothetical protein